MEFVKAKKILNNAIYFSEFMETYFNLVNLYKNKEYQKAIKILKNALFLILIILIRIKVYFGYSKKLMH